jgi:ATP-dependent helicase HrpA
MKMITPGKNNREYPDRQIKIHYPPALPIVQKKDEILSAILNNQVVIVSGETGSGKSTQIPKICLEAGRGIKGKIACTQPRRIAAITIAHRIAEELGQSVGQTVGYKIRFDEKLTRQSTVKIMTDGILLAETQHDPYLKQYDTIIVDEAHERSVNIDFILGIIQTLLKRRKDLKVIITSATLDTEKFSRAFHNAPIIEVSGRMYQVALRYRPLDKDLEDKGDLTYIDAAIGAVDDLLMEAPRGDVLVFMPTEQDIRECCEILKGRNYEDVQILPLFARLSWTDQKKVFQAVSSRKVIVATNIAETSLTIPGVRFVVDAGLARVLRYNPRTGTTSLPILPIAKSSADQRKGRCGRVQDGMCVRLYSEADYHTRSEFNTPEILRSNLAGVILKMLSLNLPDIHSFPFIDKPSGKAIKDGFDLLYELGAISKGRRSSKENTPYQLTDKGRLMALMPIDPRVARMIIEGNSEKCLHEVIVIASALSIQDPRERPAEKEKQADEIHRLLKNPQSDFLTLLNIWLHYGNTWENFPTQNKMRMFCREHFLSYRRMREWQDIYQQIVTILQQNEAYKNQLSACLDGCNQEKLTLPEMPIDNPRYMAIHKSILSGYLSHIAQKKEKKTFTAIKGKDVFIFPGSSLFRKSGKWIVAAEYVETSKLYARTVAHIDPDWLEKLGGQLCKRSYFDPHWDKDKGEVTAFVQISLFGFIIVPRRLVSYGNIDPQLAGELFLDALVDGDISQRLPFLLYNQRLIERVKRYEEKIRKRDLLVKREKQIEFYRSRISGIISVKALQKVIFEKGSDDFLRMKEEDLLVRDIDNQEISADYPDNLQFGNITLQLSYAFDPGSDKDGVTLKVPINALAGMAYESVDWLVPGLKEGRVYGLLKGLPKHYRKQLHPIKEKVAMIVSGMNIQGKSFLSSLSQYIKAEFGIDVPLSAWSTEVLDEHLRMRYEIVDETGTPLSAGRDLKTLFAEAVNGTENKAFEEAKARWEKHDLVSFELDELPEKITFEFHGQVKGHFYPAMTDQGATCSVKLFRDPTEAATEHQKGMIRCYACQLKDRIKNLKKLLLSHPELMSYLNQMGDTKERINQIIDKAILNVYDVSIRNYKGYKDSLDRGTDRFSGYALELLKQVIQVLKSFDNTRRTIHNLTATNQNNPSVLSYLARIKSELNALLPPDFLLYLGRDDFVNLVRYIRALQVRAERGVLNLEKDRIREKEVMEFIRSLDELTQEMGPICSPEKRRNISELSRMIQEYKVSVFAQEIKTALPVSRKRLLVKIREIKEMA